jgi:hypothetical protein
METDREVLLWFHQRLVHQHKESHLFDYMHRLRWIIQATPARKTSRGERVKQTCNSVGELGKLLKRKTEFEKRLIQED